MNIHLLYLSLALILIGLSSCNDDPCIRGSRYTISESRSIGGYDAVDVRDGIDVAVYGASYYEVVVTGDDNIVPFIDTDVRGGALRITMDGGCYEDYDAYVEVYMPEVVYVETRQGSDVLVEGYYGQRDLTIDARGPGDVTLIGYVDELYLDKSGTGDVYGYGLETLVTYLDKSGSGDLEILALDEIVGDMSGSGDLYYRAYPAISLEKSGTGDIINDN